MGVQGRRYKPWWSGNDAGSGNGGILVKEVTSGNMEVMENIITLGVEVMRVVYALGHNAKDRTQRMSFF